MQTPHNRIVTANSPRRKWRNLLINPSFQWKYTALFMMTVFAVAALMSVMVYGVYVQQARAQAIALIQNPSAPPTHSALVTLLLTTLGFSTVAAGAVGVWSIFFTHRISGPVYVLTGWINELAKGRIPHIRPLRKRDELKELGHALNEAVNVLRVQKQQEIVRLTEAARLALKLETSVEQDRLEALEKLRAELDALRREAAETIGETLEEQRGPRAKPSPVEVDRPLAHVVG